MSNKREPLLSDEQLFGDASPLFANDGRDNRIALYFVGLCEADRAKDAELIQRLVDGLQQIADEGHWTPYMDELLNAAAAAGFKPSDR